MSNNWLGPCHPAGILELKSGVTALSVLHDPDCQHCTLADHVTALEIHAAESSTELWPGNKKHLFITRLDQFLSLLFSALERGVRVTELWVPR